MQHGLRMAVLAGALVLFAGPAPADPRITEVVPPSAVEDEKRTLLGLYVRAAEAKRLLAANPDMMLIDVRPARLVAATGKARMAVAHVPILVERVRPAGEAPDATAPTMRINPNFLVEMKAVLAAHKLGSDATILMFCGLGLFSARAVDLLAENGFANVYAVVDGAGE